MKLLEKVISGERENIEIITSPKLMVGNGVYFIEIKCLLPLMKIGYTTNGALSRIQYGATFCPFDLEPVLFFRTEDENSAKDLERTIHYHFKHVRHKREWFWITEEMTVLINRVRDYKSQAKILSESKRNTVKSILAGKRKSRISVCTAKPKTPLDYESISIESRFLELL